MKSILNYYIFITIPFCLIILLSLNKIISNKEFVILLFIYGLIYHPLISGLRLIESNKISKNQFWKNFIPGWNIKFFYFLFFNSNGLTKD